MPETNRNIEVQSIHIRRWTTNGPYDCDVVLKGEHSEMKLKLNPEKTQQVIEVVADLIVDGARDIADSLSRDALQVGSILEHKE